MTLLQSAHACADNAGRASTEAVGTSMPTNETPTYSVFTWDHTTQSWHARDRRATKWRLRRWLRKLYAESWDHISILIERNP